MEYEILDRDGYLTHVGSKNYWQNFDVNYKNLHTTTLLKLLSILRSDSSKYADQIPGFQKRIDGLKKVLATREHIPNKIERALIRKQKAKNNGRRSKRI